VSVNEQGIEEVFFFDYFTGKQHLSKLTPNLTVKVDVDDKEAQIKKIKSALPTGTGLNKAKLASTIYETYFDRGE